MKDIGPDLIVSTPTDDAPEIDKFLKDESFMMNTVARISVLSGISRDSEIKNRLYGPVPTGNKNFNGYIIKVFVFQCHIPSLDPRVQVAIGTKNLNVAPGRMLIFYPDNELYIELMHDSIRNIESLLSKFADDKLATKKSILETTDQEIISLRNEVLSYLRDSERKFVTSLVNHDYEVIFLYIKKIKYESDLRPIEKHTKLRFVTQNEDLGLTLKKNLHSMLWIFITHYSEEENYHKFVLGRLIIDLVIIDDVSKISEKKLVDDTYDMNFFIGRISNDFEFRNYVKIAKAILTKTEKSIVGWCYENNTPSKLDFSDLFDTKFILDRTVKNADLKKTSLFDFFSDLYEELTVNLTDKRDRAILFPNLNGE